MYQKRCVAEIRRRMLLKKDATIINLSDGSRTFLGLKFNKHCRGK